MTILSAQSIEARCSILDPTRRMLSPFRHRYDWNPAPGSYNDGQLRLTGGLGPAGYDLSLDLGQGRTRLPIYHGQFLLVAAQEEFRMPDDVICRVCDKSSWARRGLTVQNTVVEPGWRGFLTIELINHGKETLYLEQGMPIAQALFELLDQPTVLPYGGRYQNQEAGPQVAR